MDAREIKQRYIDANGEEDLPRNVQKIFEAAASFVRKNDAVGFEEAMEGISGLTGEVKYNVNKVLNLEVPDDELGLQGFRDRIVELVKEIIEERPSDSYYDLAA